MSRFNALIFDFDYTLADSSEAVVECMKYALNNLGLRLPSDEDIKRTIGMSLGKTFEILSGKNDEVMLDGFIRLFKEKADEVALDKTYILDGVESVIIALKRRDIPLGIVSTKYRYRIKNVLRRDDLLDHFDVIVGGEDVAEHKPNPDGLNAAISRLKVNKENVLYIGDSVTDAETARNAGITFAAVLTGVTPKTDFAEYAPIAIVDGLCELLRIT
ncbi:MAG: HAD-IA family hydrolase [bacterium]|nr:HAD-IA family hydrolase [bacterium]